MPCFLQLIRFNYVDTLLDKVDTSLRLFETLPRLYNARKSRSGGLLSFVKQPTHSSSPSKPYFLQEQVQEFHPDNPMER